MTTAARTSSVPAAIPAAVHRPRAAEPLGCAATGTALGEAEAEAEAAAEEDADAEGAGLLAILLSGGTRVPTG